MADNHSAQQQQPIQKKENNTGLPDNLKTGMENLSGHSMDDVKVHRNSDKPAQLNAHAYAQGTDIHLGPGQEKHLPHELGHVVQQKEGRVKATKQLKGKTPINDDVGLEKEADVLGVKASTMSTMSVPKTVKESPQINSGQIDLAQRAQIVPIQLEKITIGKRMFKDTGVYNKAGIKVGTVKGGTELEVDKSDTITIQGKGGDHNAIAVASESLPEIKMGGKQDEVTAFTGENTKNTGYYIKEKRFEEAEEDAPAEFEGDDVEQFEMIPGYYSVPYKQKDGKIEAQSFHKKFQPDVGSLNIYAPIPVALGVNVQFKLGVTPNVSGLLDGTVTGDLANKKLEATATGQLDASINFEAAAKIQLGVPNIGAIEAGPYAAASAKGKLVGVIKKERGKLAKTTLTGEATLSGDIGAEAGATIFGKILSKKKSLYSGEIAKATFNKEAEGSNLESLIPSSGDFTYTNMKKAIETNVKTDKEIEKEVANGPKTAWE